MNIHDEISMTQEPTFDEHLNLTLELIHRRPLPIRGFSQFPEISCIFFYLLHIVISQLN